MAQQLTPEQLKEAQKRVEEKKKEIQVQKEKEAKLAPKLTKMLLEGIKFSETINVKTKDGREYSVELYALPDTKIFDLMRQTGIKTLDDLAKMEGADLKIVEFMCNIAVESLNRGGEKWSLEELSAILPLPEILKMGNKALELTGFIATEIDQKTVQGFLGTDQKDK